MSRLNWTYRPPSLSDQADLQSALNAKASTSALTSGLAGKADIGDVPATTSDLPEGSNEYFTDARAKTAVVDDAISNGVTDKAPSQNAVFDALATKANSGDVPATTSDLPEGTNEYFTDARAKAAAVSDTLTDGITDVAPSQNAVFDALTSVAAAIPTSTSDLPEGTNEYFTDSRAKTAAVADSITDGVTDVAPSQNAVFDALALKADATSVPTTTDDLTEGTTNKYYTDVRAKTAVVADSITDGVTDVAPSQNAVFDALALKQDAANTAADAKAAAVADSITDGVTDVAPSQNAVFDALALKADSGDVPGTTDDLTEGSTNLYFTDDRAKAAVVDDSISDSITDKAPSQNAVFDALALKQNAANTAADAKAAAVADSITDGVTDVAPSQNAVFDALALKADVGVVPGTTDDLTEGATNLYYTDARADARITAQKGAVNGLATLDAGGKVPAGQLPSYVDDVLDYANLAAFPVSGETGKIYVADDTGKTYRWSGSIYVEISASEVNSVNGQTGVVSLTTDNVSEGATNKYFTDARAKAAVVIDSIADADTDHAPSRNAVFDALALKEDAASVPADVRATLLTGLVANAGTPVAGDQIIQAFDKLVGNIPQTLMANQITVFPTNPTYFSYGVQQFGTDLNAAWASIPRHDGVTAEQGTNNWIVLVPGGNLVPASPNLSVTASGTSGDGFLTDFGYSAQDMVGATITGPGLSGSVTISAIAVVSGKMRATLSGGTLSATNTNVQYSVALPLQITGTTNGTDTITGCNYYYTGLIGKAVTGTNIPGGATIIGGTYSAGNSSIQISANTTGSGATTISVTTVANKFYCDLTRKRLINLFMGSAALGDFTTGSFWAPNAGIDLYYDLNVQLSVMTNGIDATRSGFDIACLNSQVATADTHEAYKQIALGGTLRFMDNSSTGGSSPNHISLSNIRIWANDNTKLSLSGTTNTNTSITGLTDTSKISVGQAISGTGIQSNTYVSAIVSATAITISKAATASATVTLAFGTKCIEGDGATSGTHNISLFKSNIRTVCMYAINRGTFATNAVWELLQAQDTIFGAGNCLAVNKWSSLDFCSVRGGLCWSSTTQVGNEPLGAYNTLFAGDYLIEGPAASTIRLDGVSNYWFITNGSTLSSNTTKVITEAIDASSIVSGSIPRTQGGTGVSSASLTDLFNQLDPLTTKGDLITHNGTDSIRAGVGSDGQSIVADSTDAKGWKWSSAAAASTDAQLTATFDGLGATLASGKTIYLPMVYGGTITSITLVADQSGSVVIDIWKDTYANYPPTIADTITSATPPTLVSATKGQDSTLTGWNKTFSAGDVYAFSIISCTTIQWASLIVKFTKN